MRYWWVNQNQTYRHEAAGGYLWSPKRNANGARNPFYETMREVALGDIIFSFVDTRIVAIGIATSYRWESPKPLEFGSAGQNWENVGWRVRVSFTPLMNRVRPKDHMDLLRAVLPAKYSPLQASGNGQLNLRSFLPPIVPGETIVDDPAFRHSHGGTGSLSTHSPRRAVRASRSRPCRIVSCRAYR